jgi:hypothetical protein
MHANPLEAFPKAAGRREALAPAVRAEAVAQTEQLRAKDAQLDADD